MTTSGSGAAGHRFHPTILREYDVRGIVDETLFAADALASGARLRPCRAPGWPAGLRRHGWSASASLTLAEAMIEGLCASGVDAVDRLRAHPDAVPRCTTWMPPAASRSQASHNPPAHNGFKMMLGKKSFFGSQIQELGRIAASGAYADHGRGRRTEAPVFDAYVDRLARDYPADGRELAVVWDAGNGAAGEVLSALARRLPGRHELLFADIDGRFPNHHPDPTVDENLAHLMAAVARAPRSASRSMAMATGSA